MLFAELQKFKKCRYLLLVGDWVEKHGVTLVSSVPNLKWKLIFQNEHLTLITKSAHYRNH